MRKICLLPGLLLILLLTGITQAQEQTPYEIALERILEAERTGATELDLSGLGLSELPPELWELSELHYLNLWDNKLNSLSPDIGQLTNLQALDLGANNLNNLPMEIWHLSTLQSLSLYANQLSILPADIGDFHNLRILHLCYNEIGVLPDEIVRLINLSYLSLCHNNLNNLPSEIGQLTNLCYLDIRYNELTELPELSELLKFLEVQYTGLTHPPELFDDCTGLASGIQLAGNPLISPPPEVIAQGTPTILEYLRNPTWWHIKKMIMYVASGIGFVTLVFAGLWYRRRRGNRKSKQKRGEFASS